jgi:hypothetical protein
LYFHQVWIALIWQPHGNLIVEKRLGMRTSGRSDFELYDMADHDAFFIGGLLLALSRLFSADFWKEFSGGSYPVRRHIKI